MLHGWLVRFVAARQSRQSVPHLLGTCVLALGGTLLWAACGASDADRNPSEVLLRFVEAMDRSLQHEAALKDAFALLDENAQRELSARAQRASSLASRSFAPWEMIAQGRFRMRFAPLDHAELRTSVSGDRAQVHVKDEDGRTADVPLVREHGHWRVKLELPTLAQSAPRTP